MAREMLYFKMKEAMTEDCCPICRMVAEGTERLMDSFLYESVNDSALRRSIQQDRGFCGRHAEMLMEKGDPLAHALIYGELLKLAERDAKKGHFEHYGGGRGCLFCRREEETEKTCIQAFVSFFRETEFRTQYEAGGLLCMRHLGALREADSHAFEPILRSTCLKYEVLAGQLDEIRQKNDYRFSALPWSPGTKTAWKKAVRVLNGEKGSRASV